MNGFHYLRDVVTLSIEKEKCIGCGMCSVVCPHRVFALTNGKADIEDRDACMECGACSMNCPADAIQVRKGVGCAAAVINAALGRKRSGCCCTLETEDMKPQGLKEKAGCC